MQERVLLYPFIFKNRENERINPAKTNITSDNILETYLDFLHWSKNREKILVKNKNSMINIILQRTEDDILTQNEFYGKRIAKWKKNRFPEILCRICETMVQADKMIVLLIF